EARGAHPRQAGGAQPCRGDRQGAPGGTARRLRSASRPSESGMTHRALLIGAQTNGLAGVDNDVTAMAGALAPRGFQLTTLTGADASRDGILDAYRKLIADARHGDACVVYYSGHGGLLRDATDGGGELAERRPDLQFIVPADY